MKMLAFLLTALLFASTNAFSCVGVWMEIGKNLVLQGQTATLTLAQPTRSGKPDKVYYYKNYFSQNGTAIANKKLVLKTENDLTIELTKFTVTNKPRPIRNKGFNFSIATFKATDNNTKETKTFSIREDIRIPGFDPINRGDDYAESEISGLEKIVDKNTYSGC